MVNRCFGWLGFLLGVEEWAGFGVLCIIWVGELYQRSVCVKLVSCYRGCGSSEVV